MTFFVELWFEEVNEYGDEAAPVDGYVENQLTRGYTQLVWAETYAVGCGYKVYEEGEENVFQLVCNYVQI